MSIATEIQRLQNAKANIKTAIENKGVTVGDGTIDTYAEKIGEISGGGGDYNQGYEDGKNSVVPLERYAKTITFADINMFGKAEVVLNLDSATTLNNLFYQVNNNTVEHLTVNCPNLITSIQQFHQASDITLKRLTLNVDTQKVASYINAFIGNQSLEIIDGLPLDFSNKPNQGGMFTNCVALREVRIVKETIYKDLSISQSPNLSNETRQSIIDGLADLTGGTAQTLTLHKDVGAKLTDEQKATITAKNWTLVY